VLPKFGGRFLTLNALKTPVTGLCRKKMDDEALTRQGLRFLGWYQLWVRRSDSEGSAVAWVGIVDCSIWMYLVLLQTNSAGSRVIDQRPSKGLAEVQLAPLRTRPEIRRKGMGLFSPDFDCTYFTMLETKHPHLPKRSVREDVCQCFQSLAALCSSAIYLLAGCLCVHHKFDGQ